MDKNAIKKYAVWARRELIERVSQRAMIYGITANDMGDPNAESVNGHLLSQTEKHQRQALIRNIKVKGYEQVMEEVAYTWFNRFAALRFMEVNGYLPSHIRVFTNDAGEFKPQILAEAIHLELDGLDMNKVYELESANKSEELFKYLLIVQCNALNSILPGMFQRIEDYTELLLPDYLLREGSVIEQMVTTIPEEDWTDQVQIIGWLYQYYNTEPKDKVFADLKKNIKITKENIPAATQLFTPDWIVHYMVENSLGRLWLEGHPNDALKSEWKYYLDEAEQEPEVQVQLDAIRKEYAALKPEEIRVIDPCMGSGHILCVLFDVLVRIYEDYGYTAREAAVKIVENNLWGLDIDERAAQLSYFAVMMKARQYDRRFFTRKVQPHVYAIHETNALGGSYGYDMGGFLLSKEHQETLNYLLDAFIDAKEYGSILQLEDRDYKGLKDAWEYTASQTATSFNLTLWYAAVAPEVPHLIEQAIALSQKYDVIVTNPPYMGSDSMSPRLKKHVTEKFYDERYDLYAVFMQVSLYMRKMHGLISLITQNSYLFALCFSNLRNDLLLRSSIVNAVHLGPRAFEEISGEVVQTIAAVFSEKIAHMKSSFIRLVGYSENKEMGFFQEKPYVIDCDFFEKLPNKVFAYSLSDAMKGLCLDRTKIGDKFMSKAGVVTGKDDYFLRYWHEVSFPELDLHAIDTTSKYVPFSKGGSFVKWYGNITYAIKIADLWTDSKVSKSVRRGDITAYYKRCIGWSYMGGGNKKNFSILEGCVCGTGTPTILNSVDSEFYYTLGFLNTKIPQQFIELFNPTLNTYASDICNLPYVFSKEAEVRVVELSRESISIAREDWDSYETSWDFQRHSLVNSAINLHFMRLADCWHDWVLICNERFTHLKANEEELNRIFIDIYGLRDELAPDVEDKDVTVRKADLQHDIRSLISYIVGCMFGRYSLDVPGLVYAGGTWDASKYTSFQPDKDAIIPICDDEYFDDDIVGRFIKFIEVVYGKETLEENLRFIADALGGKGSSREVIRNYFINDFYTDHLKVYQKRPIYWLFDSGKKNGFKCLIYMHRYQPDTIARIRTDYVHEQQSRYRTAIADLEQRINGASTSERVKLSKQLATLQAQAEEIRVYEEKIHHLADQMIKIDLDDGVKHNYEIFKDVLAKII